MGAVHGLVDRLLHDRGLMFRSSYDCVDQRVHDMLYQLQHSVISTSSCRELGGVEVVMHNCIDNRAL